MPTLRDLPWRQTRDPWAILVAEVMLQQTQVPRVIPKWQAFLHRFPTPTACAQAPLGDVLRLWQGLGYPRRARNLHLAAAGIVERHGGAVPQSLDDLLALAGVGQYTARAVRVFAYELPDAVVDTNIARVFARVSGRRMTPRAVQAAADASVPVTQGWIWNQVLMDLGATVCRPGRPPCERCPLAPSCAWASAQWPEPDPAEGSAGVSTRQSRFEGSDRQARGRLIKALTQATLTIGEVADVMQRPPATALRLTAMLVDEGLVRRDDDDLRLA